MLVFFVVAGSQMGPDLIEAAIAESKVEKKALRLLHRRLIWTNHPQMVETSRRNQ